MIINFKKLIKVLNKKSKSKYPGIWYIFKYRPRFRFRFGSKFKSKSIYRPRFKFRSKFKKVNINKFKKVNINNLKKVNINKFKKANINNLKKRYSIFKVLTKLYINNILSN